MLLQHIVQVAIQREFVLTDNLHYPGMKCGGTPIPDEDDDCWYWTSTEVEGQATAKAWLYSLGSGAIQETPKWQPHKARPIITIMDKPIYRHRVSPVSSSKYNN